MSEPRPLPLPESGLYLVDDWIAICGCSDDSVRDTIKRYSVPVIAIPGMRIIDAAVWWSTIRKQGGDRP